MSVTPGHVRSFRVVLQEFAHDIDTDILYTFNDPAPHPVVRMPGGMIGMIISKLVKIRRVIANPCIPPASSAGRK
jgi:hypothetical protein